jgi:hypothetical protein
VTTEFYILSSLNDINNVKIRNGKMDIKRLLARESGMEKWVRVLKIPFPLGREVIHCEVYPALMLPDPLPARQEYGIEKFFTELIEPEGNLSTVRVDKKRSLFARGHCSAEFARLGVEGIPYHSIALESEERGLLVDEIKYFGLSGEENTNYIQFLKHLA